jgi:hypothetical protein
MALPPTVHLLRICNDFGNIVLRSLPPPYLESPKAIENLENLTEVLTSDEIGTAAWFKKVLSFISILFEGEVIQHQFICAFLSRALSLSADDDYQVILDLTLERIVKDAGLVAQSGLVISGIVSFVSF